MLRVRFQVKVAGRADLQLPAERLDPELALVLVEVGHHLVDRRSSSAPKKARSVSERLGRRGPERWVRGGHRGRVEGGRCGYHRPVNRPHPLDLPTVWVGVLLVEWLVVLPLFGRVVPAGWPRGFRIAVGVAVLLGVTAANYALLRSVHRRQER